MHADKGHLRKRRVAEKVLRTREEKEAEVKRIFVGLLIWGVLGFGMSFYGTWDFTLQLLPIQQIYESNLVLDCVFAPGWRIESESKIYSGGVFKYQNFYISGSFGDFDVWGKMYFHAQEVRYQKMWLNAEIPVGQGTFRASFNHWATRSDYSSYDRDTFGEWPCYVWVAAAPVIEATDLVASWAGPTDPRVGQLYYVHGTIVAYYPSSPTTYVNLYLVANYPNKRFIVYIRFADFSPPITLGDVLARLGASTLPEVVGKEICVFGFLVNFASPPGVNNPEIILANSPHQLADLNLGACHPEMILVPWEGPYINWRYTFTWLPFKITADFSDCCEGTWFRQAKIELSDVALCCGLFLDASLTFTKAAGLEKAAFSLGDLYLPCCGITATVSAEFTPTSKTVKFEPHWRGVSGCFTVYGDVKWTPNIIQGIELYGYDITCYTGNVKLRLITAFDPDKVEDITDITFYTDEWEYMGLTYTGKGCCGGDLTLTLESWFGNRGLIFDFQRFKFDFEVPLTSTVTVFTKAQWNFANASPLDWFDVGWKISF